MHNKMSVAEVPTLRQLAWFVGVTFVLGTTAQMLAIRTGLEGKGRMWLLLAMWVPAISVVCAGASARKLACAMLKKFSWRFLGPGLLLGFAPTILKTLLLAMTGTGHWDSQHYALSQDGRSVNSIHHLMVLGSGRQSFLYFGSNLALTLTVWAIVAALLAIGEEIGWRGVLQPWMEARYGRVGGTVLVGLVWAYWHLPLNLTGYNDSSHPFLSGTVLFPVVLVAISFVLAWLRRSSQSVWPAALAHGAHNTISPAFLLAANGWAADCMGELAGTLFVAGVFIAGAARFALTPGGIRTNSSMGLTRRAVPHPD